MYPLWSRLQPRPRGRRDRAVPDMDLDISGWGRDDWLPNPGVYDMEREDVPLRERPSFCGEIDA